MVSHPRSSKYYSNDTKNFIPNLPVWIFSWAGCALDLNLTTLESKNIQRNEFQKDSQLVSWSIPTNPPVPAEKFEVPGKILSNLKVNTLKVDLIS